MVTLRDHEAPRSAVDKVLVDKVPHADIALHGATVPLHKVADRMVTKPDYDSDLRVTVPGGIKQEPTDKRHPQPAEVGTNEESKQSIENENPCDNLTNLGR